MSVVRSYFFDDKDISASGAMLGRVFRGNTENLSGVVEQVIVEKLSGSATTVDVEIRYIIDDSSFSKLVYQNDDGSLDLVDSAIAAPFHLDTYDNLYLWVQPDQDGSFNVRIDVILDSNGR